jgi:nitrite reductase/ring-hydroxylating ferredoxin subunit
MIHFEGAMTSPYNAPPIAPTNRNIGADSSEVSDGAIRIPLAALDGQGPHYQWIGQKTEVVIIVKSSEGYRVFSSICPHMGARLCLDGGLDLSCPWHGLKFDLRNLTSNNRRYRVPREYSAVVSGSDLLIEFHREG